jgi:hypothetical protein
MAMETSAPQTYLDELSRATYNSISATVVFSTGLPHDRFDASLFDAMPQFAVARTIPYTGAASGASLEVSRCTSANCVYTGSYGLEFQYHMPPGTWGSYNVDAPHFDASQATYLEAYVKGAQGGEKFEFVLWSWNGGNCGPWPGRPSSAEISVSQAWEERRIPLTDFQPYADLSNLCRISIGFNDAMDSGGTVYIDQIAFVDASGDCIPMPLDETTNVTNIGLYVASVLGALELGWESYTDVVAAMSTTVTSIEAFQKWHGFPQTHNHVVSLEPSSSDECISFVDTGNLAAGLVLLRQRIPELRGRVDAILDAMEWDWLFDSSVGLPYGCRYPDGSASGWHYDWLAADSRLGHFIGIGSEEIPPDSWCRLNRSLEPNWCTSLPYETWHFEPGWDGGGLFMHFLPGIFMRETQTPLGEIGISACNSAQDQIGYARQIGAPAWGWSATALPPYGAEYCGYGCAVSTITSTLVPHASILAVDCISPTELVTNLLALEGLGARPPVRDGAQTMDYGFVASVNWQTGDVATVYLVLDQSMAFLSLVNHSTNGGLRDIYYQDEIPQEASSLVPECSGVSLSPGYSEANEPGTVVSYTHILVNTGNHTDTISLSVTSSQDWSVLLMGGAYPDGTTLLPLQRGAGMTATVYMSLTVPASATIGTVETTTITATSQADTMIYSVAIDTTTVEPWYTLIPLVLRDQ